MSFTVRPSQEELLEETLTRLLWSLDLRSRAEREKYRRQAQEVLEAVRAERQKEWDQ